MTKSDERAIKARSLILKGEQKVAIARELGYKSVGGMMGAIAALEEREKNSRLEGFVPYVGKMTRAQNRRLNKLIELKENEPKVDVLGETWTQGITLDTAENDGLYARLEGRHMLMSHIGYRGSLNIEAKHFPGRAIRLYATEMGGRAALLDALVELRDMSIEMIAMIEGRGHEECDQ